jgi:uncharacterized protein YodC (DUF2158 family)
MAQFKKGNVVLLKSGGPLMTIQTLGDYSHASGIEEGALCVWFDGLKRQEAVFDVDSLELYVEDRG